MSKKLSTKDFIKKANIIHSNFYNYSKTEYINSKIKVIISCPEHGDFEQVPSTHIKGSGCPKCKGFGFSRGEQIERLNKIHNSKYDYSKTNFKGTLNHINVVCPIHGEFSILLKSHINGAGCQKCGLYKATVDKCKKGLHFKNKYKNIDILIDDNSVYTTTDIVSINCKIHGLYKKRISLIHQGCPKCNKEKKVKEKENRFIECSSLVHNNKYNYSEVSYTNNRNRVDIICPTHGKFKQTPNNHKDQKAGCPVCGNGNTSIAEKEIFDFLSNFVICELNKKDLLKNKEIDIYIPELNIGIEYDGLHWHNELYKNKNYHKNKTELCKNQNIRLIHIFEDEWLFKKDIVKSRLLNIIGKTQNKIFARNCVIKNVTTKEARGFLEQNHIQGFVGGRVKIGLYYNSELVSLMTFGSLRKNMGQNSTKNLFELLRFCNKLNTTVVGGASKLFKHFITTYNPIEVISYADIRWSNGNLYEKLCFDFLYDTRPNYFYVKGNKREGRFKYRKSELLKIGFEENLTEAEIMKQMKFYRIYDCGCKKYKWKNSKL